MRGCADAVASGPACVAAPQRTRPRRRPRPGRRGACAGCPAARCAGPIFDHPAGEQSAATRVPDRGNGRRPPPPAARPPALPSKFHVEIDDRFAEYDRDLPVYIPIEQIRAENPQQWARMAQGHLPSTVDEDGFRARVRAAVDNVAATAEHEDTVAVFSHGGVINVVLHEILGTRRVLSFPIAYVSVTRLLFSRFGP